jgi:beta-lactamase class A
MDVNNSGVKPNKNFFNSAWVLVALFFCLGGAAGFFLHQAPPIAQLLNPVVSSQRAGGYQFINPLLDFDLPQNTFVELKPFKDKIENFTNTASTSSSHIDFAAVYFRDLNNGPWFGVGENASFSPASLLKVPLMMAYYKISESEPGVLQKQIPVTTQDIVPIVPNQQTIVPSVRLEIGKSYSVDELINRMIIYSDNDAAQLLIENIDPGKLVKIYTDFGIELPDAEPSGTQVDVKTYAGFFRILFNASYLNRDNSEKALKLLSQVEFKDGLVAGVPGNILTAHKFGERIGDGNQQQLHDCGIVYYPGHPYLLCVMTRGNSALELEKFIQDTSRLVFEEIDKQYQGR